MKRLCFFCILCLIPFFGVMIKSAHAADRGLFVSVIQNPPTLSSLEDIDNLVRFAKKARIQILFVQVYRGNRAWFASKVSDSAPYELCRQNLSGDAFALLIKKAHAAGIQVHAWVNLLSLGDNPNAVILKKYGPDILTKNRKKKSVIEDYRIDKQFFLEPGDLRVRQELSDMVGELVSAYPDLDGIQFDYIRYPDSKPFYGYTKMNMDRFKKSSGIQVIEEPDPAWKTWRRRQVTELLEILIAKARAIHPDIQVSATGLTPFIRAYYESFQDWRWWLDSGLVDFVTIMDYSADTAQFSRFLEDAKRRVKNLDGLYVGIGAYKVVNDPEIFDKQFAMAERSGCGLSAVFHYGSLLENEELMKTLLLGQEE